MFGGFPRSHKKGPSGPRGTAVRRPLRTKPVVPSNPDSSAVVRSITPSDLPKGAHLSVLVLTSDEDPCEQLLSDLATQIGLLGDPPIEVLIRKKAGVSVVSAELSRLLWEAAGHFVVFLGRGDEIAPDYVGTLLEAIRRNPYADCIGMRGLWSTGHGVPRMATYSVRNEGDYESGGIHMKPPGPCTAIRRDIASRYEFVASPLGEGREWSLRLLADRVLSKEVFIDKVMHHHKEPVERFNVSGGWKLRISCILTSYNRPTFLRQALRSLKNQTHRNFELLVFDDSSRMDVRPILKEFGLPVGHLVVSKVSPKERASVSRLSLNINKGLKLATGDLVCFLADDDYYFPSWFEEAASFFADHPKVNVGYGRLMYSRSREMEFRAIGQSRWPGIVLSDPFEQVDHNQVIHRRFKVPFQWPESFSTVTNPDAHYFKAVAKKHPFYPIDANAAVKRIHAKNLQNTASEVASGRAENIRE